MKSQSHKTHEILSRDPVLRTILERLINAYSPQTVFLFGSKARGESGPDSDYDILIVVPDDAPVERQKGRLAYQVLRGTGVAADVAVWTQSAFEKRLHIVASLPATVKREGKILYAA